MTRSRIRRLSIGEPSYRRALRRLHAAPHGCVRARRRELVETVRKMLEARQE